MNFSAVILAGGKSSRMGRDKARLEVGGQTLLARQIQLVRETGATEVLLSSRAETDYAEFGCRVLPDKYSGAGPLAGIERALNAANSHRLLVLAVDLPEMKADFLKRLLANCSENAGIIPRLNGNIEPLAAIYPKSSHPLIEVLLRDGNNAVVNFASLSVESGTARFLELSVDDARHFTNWNSPADLASKDVNRSSPA